MNEGTPIIIKKKKIMGHGHHGGSWKVAYADFVTAMMAFFMVMWIMGMDPATKSMVQGYFNDPAGFMRNPPSSKSIISIPGVPSPKPAPTNRGAAEQEKDTEELENLEAKLKQTLKKGVPKELLENTEFTITGEGLRIELVEKAGAVFFESGSANIRPQARALIAKFGPMIAESGRRIIIEGHTDGTPFSGTGYDNWDLSTDRAAAVRRMLANSGVPSKNFLQVRGYADTQLKRPDDPSHFSNRRVTVLLPLKAAMDAAINSLPTENIKRDVQGMFHMPLGLKPAEPAISPKHEPESQ